MFRAVVDFFQIHVIDGCDGTLCFIMCKHLQYLDISDISRWSDKILTSMTCVAARRWANDDVGPIMHHGVKDPKDVTSFYYQECSFLLK